MSAGQRTQPSSNVGVRGSRANVDAAKKWVAEETRAEAKEVFAQHTRETSNLDVLSRCKKLNELLSSDVLKGKGDAKAQLKEILGILHAGPKRPAFLDKPPVTAIAGKQAASSSAASSTPPPNSSAPVIVTDDGGNAEQASREPTYPAAPSSKQPLEEVDDIITLLNGSIPRGMGHGASTSGPSSVNSLEQGRQAEHAAVKTAELEEQKRVAAEREQKAKEVAEAAERERRAKEAAEAAEGERRAKEAAEAAERERRAKEAAVAAERERRAKEAAEAAELERRAKEAAEAAERERRAKEVAEAAELERRAKEAAAAEALRLQRVQNGAALCIQSHWRGHCGRRQAALRRLELAEQHAAACIMQAAWRCRQNRVEYRARLVAAGTLQCAVRAWRARRHLHDLRVEAFRRRRAARVILRALLAYRARWNLGPLRVPHGGRPLSSSCSVDGAALLAKQLRLRSAVDTRLAPECVMSSGGGADDDGARQHRTVVTHMERVRQVSANERNRRCDVSERAIMVASEHRDATEALAIARAGYGTCTPRTPSPTTSWPPHDGVGVRPESRGSSSSRLGSEAGGQQAIAGMHSVDVAFLAAARPPTGLRRTQGGIGGSGT